MFLHEDSTIGRRKGVFIMRGLGEQGFTLLEILVVCTALGVLSAIALPKFTNAIALANTAKLQSDLQTLDAAIVMYETERGMQPKSLADLSDYVTDIENLKPPVGKCKLKGGEIVEIKDTSYEVKIVKDAGDGTERSQMRAVCGERTAGAFGR